MKKITLVFIGLLFLLIFAGYRILDKNFSSIQAFIYAIENLSNQEENSENTLFDLQLITKITSLAKTVNSSKVSRIFLKTEHKMILDEILQITPSLEVVVSELSSEQQKWLFLFQNSNELRATGGFIGSYAIVDINQGKIVSITTEDIYDADGQFTGYVEAPHGVKEYLSSGNGLRLPDSNWNPETNKSAEQILQFFALGNKYNITGITFVNLDFAKNLLQLTGPLELNDYNLIIDQNNIDTVLRSKRETFFPGSQQKKHILSQLLVQTRIKLSSLPISQLVAVSTLLKNEIQNHNLQFYSINPEIDAIFSRYNMRQTLQIPKEAEYLYLLESNVGINKANKHIERNILLQKQDSNRKITINFTNKNTKPETSKLSPIISSSESAELTKEASNSAQNNLAYINYQRILVPEDWKLEKILYKGKEILETHEQTITIQSGERVKEIGFLLTLEEGKNSTLEVTFTTQSNFPQVFIQMQPGLPATQYLLEYNQKKESHFLNKNNLLQYP